MDEKESSMDIKPLLKEVYTPKIKNLIDGHDPHHKHNHTNAQNHDPQGNDHDFHNSHANDMAKAFHVHSKAALVERARGHLNKLVRQMRDKKQDV